MVARSQRLRLTEVREVFRLLQECRDLGAAWELWSGHFLAGTVRLTGSQVGVMGGSQRVPAQGLFPLGPILGIGWSDESTAALAREYVRAKAAVRSPALRNLVALSQPTVVRTREQLLDDRTWYRSEEYTDWC